jgi:hypothetical protein
MPIYMRNIRNTLLQFLDVFNNIKVNKYNQAGQVTKVITVPVKLADKEKSYMYLMDHRAERATPMIAVELTGINHDASFVTGRNQQIVFNKNYQNRSYSYFYNPAPYIMDIQVHIIGRYVVEIDQILEQILCVFNPFIQTRVKVSDYDDQTADIKITLNGATPGHSSTLDQSDYRLLSWTLNFSINMFMFKPAETVSPEVSGSLISSIINRYWMDEETMDEQLAEGDVSTRTPSADGYTESVIISGHWDESAQLLISYEIFSNEGVEE